MAEKLDFKKLLDSLTQEQLKELQQATQETTESRRPRIDMNAIRPGMSNEDKTAAWSAIQSALKEGR